jgi:nucleoside-diphosphate-sugar epimerase
VTPIERFDIEASNVQMANNVYRSAYDAGAQRVVMASSNHAANWYEHALVNDKRKGDGVARVGTSVR